MNTQAIAKLRVVQACFIALSLFLCMFFSQPVHAAFPGLNGRVLFQSSRDGDGEIFSMRQDGSGLKKLTDNADAESNPSWSPDGRKILFNSNRDGNHEIYIMDADGSNQQRLTNNGATDRLPFFSPDGNRIVFTTNRDGNDEIYIMDADGSNQQNITNDPAADTSAQFSPNGDTLIFASNRDSVNKVHSMNPDGTGVTLLVNELSSEPSWHPNGSRIIYQTGAVAPNTKELTIADPDGSNPVSLTTNVNLDGTAAFSPDGSKITFFSNRDGNDEIYIMEADGSDQIQITDALESDRVPSIQPLTIQPSTVNQSISLNANSSLPVIYDVPANHEDAYEGIDPSSVVITAQPGKGSVSVDASNGHITYIPHEDSSGSDSFTYRICSAAHVELCTTATVGVVLGEATLVETGEQVTMAAVAASLILTLLMLAIPRKTYR